MTGGAGFIGSHLVRALLERGQSVRVLDNLSTGKRENLDGLGAELIVGDIREPTLVRQAVDGVGTVYHLAAMISVPESRADPVGCYQTNLMGSVNVLEAARRVGARRVILASSCAVYGETAGPVGEDAPTRPISAYATSKLAMEQAGSMYAEAYSLAVVSLRYFNVYGDRQSPDSPYAAVIPIFMRRLLLGQAPIVYGDGQQTRDFVHVEDVVRANLLAAGSPASVGGVINIAGGRSVSILEVLKELRSLIPGSPEPVFEGPRPGDIRHSAARLDRATNVLGYRPLISLAQGLQATLAASRSVGSPAQEA